MSFTTFFASHFEGRNRRLGSGALLKGWMPPLTSSSVAQSTYGSYGFTWGGKGVRPVGQSAGLGCQHGAEEVFLVT